MKTIVVVMSQNFNDLVDNHLVEYMSGAGIFAEGSFIEYDAKCQRGLYDDDMYGRWHRLGYDADFDGEVLDDGTQVYLVVIDSGRLPHVPDKLAEQFGNVFGTKKWKCSGVKHSPRHEYRMITYGFLEVAHMDALKRSLLPPVVNTTLQ